MMSDQEEKKLVSSAKDDPLIELPSLTGNELVKKSQITGMDIRSLVVKCTSCRSQINHLDYQKLKQHRVLKVIVCRDCYNFYGTEEFTKDEAGKYNYCTWCGNGGSLFCCDFCPNVFCSNCVRLNFGRSEIAKLQKDGWKCYVCDPSKIESKVAYCDMILEFSKSKYKREKKAEQENKELISEKWVLDAFNKTENACKSLIKKMDKLKHVEVSRSKSLKHIIKKMEEVVGLHKTELGQILKTLSFQYATYLKNKQDEEKLLNAGSSLNNDSLKHESSNEPSVILINSDSDDTFEQKTNVIENSKLNGDSKAIKEEKVKEKSGYANGMNADSKSRNKLEDLEKSSSFDEEEIKVKRELLKDSSEESDVNPEKSKIDNLSSLKITVTAEVHSNELEADFKREKTSNMKPVKVSYNKSSKVSLLKNCAIKESSISSLSPDSNISFSDSCGETQKVKNSKKKILSKPSKSKAEFDYTDDLKLRSRCSVVLERCDDLLNGETTIEVPAIYLLEELDKTVSNLMKEPEKKKTSSKIAAKEKKPKFRKAVPKRFQKNYSSSSITFSSEEEETERKPLFDKKKKVTNEDSEEEVKRELLESDGDSSDEELSSGSVVEVKKKSKKAKAKSDSSDDFVPRKKKKYDKLLNKRILSDDSGNEAKKKPSEKTKKKRPLASDDDDFKSDKHKTTGSDTTSDSDNETKQKSKKRRRIKKAAASSSDASEVEIKKENSQETPKKGRKDLRKIISKKDLQQETKEAQQAERERKKRIEEKQKLYNIITDTSEDGKEMVTKKMVLEVDPVSKEEIVEIHPDIVEKLKPHQVKGVQFMWECTIESLEHLKKKKGSGCILAHCMGLGKTLQVITFLHTCLTNKEVNKYIKRAMVICPYNVVLNWSKEFDLWLSKVDEDEILVHEICNAKDNYARLDILKYWFNEGGVLIISYDIFRRLAGDKIPKLRKTLKEELHRYLLDPGPEIVVCDEGHILKNETSAISKACGRLKTERRIVLTGTPLQNNLKEYHCMLSFVKPHLLGTSKEFRNRFVNPIINGQYEDSNEYDVRRMKKRIHILHKLLEGCVQRCDYSALTKFLLPKHEFVISVKLSEIQIKMYRWYLENMSKAQGQDKIRGGTLFQDYNMLRNICTHPYIVHTSHERAEKRKLSKDEDDGIDYDEYEDSFIDDSSEKSKSGSGSDTDEIIKEYKTRSRKRSNSDVKDEVEEVEEPRKEWYHEFISDSDAYRMDLSGKMVLLMNILKECEAIGDKVIVFSQSLLTLDLIEEILNHVGDEQGNEGLESGNTSWTQGVDYFRMDGGTSADFRKQFIEMFNNPSNYRARLFLVSTRAGGLGTNLVGANRVIILDASWNPSHDVQAIFRVYRFGQKKPVYIYRLLAQGTMEEKIYDRQVTKLSLSIRVVDEQQIDRHFNSAELSELYTFEPDSLSNRPTPMVPQDRLLAEMLIKYKDLIVSYHEHDSLLQNETEEDLTEEERKAAWNEFENEREGRSADDVALGEEIAKYCKEPDLSEADYNGPFIPDTKLIIDGIIQSLKTQFVYSTPQQLRKKLQVALFQMKNAFQEKQLKLLRIKQEFIAKGSVPATINKFLEELNKVINELNHHHQRVTQIINDDERKAMLEAMQKQQMPQNMQNNPNHQMPQYPRQTYTTRSSGPGFQARFPFMAQGAASMNNMPRFVNMANMRGVYIQSNPPNASGRPTTMTPGFNTYSMPKSASRPTTSQPVVTEVSPDAQKDVPQASNSTSSVTIEEIE